MFLTKGKKISHFFRVAREVMQFLYGNSKQPGVKHKIMQYS